ncbi:MAG: (d)CMP kinase [Chloroflexota bacterium]|nr:(d)CMP kinase [Chloroflexota bacterium]
MPLPVVTLDGPAGSGKTTVSRILARELGLVLVDTGLFYRSVAWVMDRQGLDADDEQLAAGVAADLAIQVHPDPSRASGQRVIVNTHDVRDDLYSPEVEGIVSDVARHPEVRRVLLPKQRETLRVGGVVVAGRDAGTVVWPQAEVKVYLDASPEVRARRKHREQEAAEGESDYEQILSLMQNRDRIDTGRKTAPLRVPEGALVIDTDALDAEAVAAQIITAYRQLPNPDGAP